MASDKTLEQLAAVKRALDARKDAAAAELSAARGALGAAQDRRRAALDAIAVPVTEDGNFAATARWQALQRAKVSDLSKQFVALEAQVAKAERSLREAFGEAEGVRVLIERTLAAATLEEKRREP